MARAGPPGRSSVLSPGHRRSGRNRGGENPAFNREVPSDPERDGLRPRARGSKNPFTCKTVEKRMRTSRNPGLRGTSISGYPSGENRPVDGTCMYHLNSGLWVMHSPCPMGLMVHAFTMKHRGKTGTCNRGIWTRIRASQSNCVNNGTINPTHT
jgi:hypothetical protein